MSGAGDCGPPPTCPECEGAGGSAYFGAYIERYHGWCSCMGGTWDTSGNVPICRGLDGATTDPNQPDPVAAALYQGITRGKVDPQIAAAAGVQLGTDLVQALLQNAEAKRAQRDAWERRQREIWDAQERDARIARERQRNETWARLSRELKLTSAPPLSLKDVGAGGSLTLKIGEGTPPPPTPKKTPESAFPVDCSVCVAEQRRESDGCLSSGDTLLSQLDCVNDANARFIGCEGSCELVQPVVDAMNVRRGASLARRGAGNSTWTIAQVVSDQALAVANGAPSLVTVDAGSAPPVTSSALETFQAANNRFRESRGAWIESARAELAATERTARAESDAAAARRAQAMKPDRSPDAQNSIDALLAVAGREDATLVEARTAESTARWKSVADDSRRARALLALAVPPPLPDSTVDAETAWAARYASSPLDFAGTPLPPIALRSVARNVLGAIVAMRLEHYERVDDPALLARVQEVVDDLVERSPQPDARVRVRLFGDPKTPEDTALRGGLFGAGDEMFVSRRFLDAHPPDGPAATFLLAHEIGHIEGDDTAARIGEKLRVKLVESLDHRGSADPELQKAAARHDLLEFSKAQERDADRLGAFLYLSSPGGAAAGVVDAMRWIHCNEDPGVAPEARDHDPPAERYRTLQARWGRVLPDVPELSRPRDRRACGQP